MSKPMNSFFLYCKMNRNKAKEAYPNRPNAEISAILGEQWRTMSVAEKRKYKELAMTKKKEFLKMNPFPQRKKKETDPFTFSFRLKQAKPADKVAQKTQKSVVYEQSQYCPIPPRTVKVNNAPPYFPSDLDLFNSLQYQPILAQYPVYNADSFLDSLL
eukprot:CAMPEP_0206156892 /NCGR_PEP_ID=MMETSP1474-20131121/3418_1 /ASSEMBLY_ACC=CAM_ASM_001110 /TAXON_ID=97495 /ORGANISM="Imantonia sp., Strain RCC918" /LENGTH=157 /DNA_ID=CAMNT_0053556203 /DNA_START=33 /DNA_END=502 /DNA_ORIENTATION=-